MGPDDEICLCFHVTRRKLVNYIRQHRPLRAAQLSECFRAGTGCGWCRTLIEQIYLETTGRSASGKEPSAADHAAMRQRYLDSGGGQRGR